MSGFLIGVGLSAAVVFFAVTWRDWRDLPKWWRTEPDRHMRPWFVVVRRVFKGPMP